LILAAWLALLFFALAPAPWNILFLLANGFPLGMIWGLVFSYVEGRRSTELMGAVLASSFIFASGFAKTVGTWLTQTMGVSEYWMPFVAGAFYFLPLLLFTGLLEAIPDPNEEDLAQRRPRLPMNKESRRQFLNAFAPGLCGLIIAYVLLTILRDFRDNFSPEILHELGLATKANIFTRIETPVALIVLLLMSLLMFVRNNYTAFYFNHIIVVAGLGIAAGSTFLFGIGVISAYSWFVLVGTGLYLGYIPINCLYFDRLIATFRLTANVGFVMYVADSLGYLGSVGILFVKNFVGLRLSWVSFFTYILYASSLIGMVSTLYALHYYRRKFLAQLPSLI
jgi:MFS family permease